MKKGIMFSIKEAAKILQLKPDNVRRLIHKKKLKGFRLKSHKIGGHWRILSSDVEDYLLREYNSGKGL